jgi:hypothetical protein
MGFAVERIVPREDKAGNLIHLLLIAGSLAMLAARRPWRSGRLPSYGVALLLGFVLFSGLLKWQQIHSRLHLPLFVLWAPLAGVLLERLNARLLVLAALAMIGWAWPFLAHNRLHPLVGEDGVFTTSRVDQLFLADPALKPQYVGATGFLRTHGCTQIGLLVGPNSQEYPFWALLPEVRASGGRWEHVGVTNSSARLARSGGVNFRPCAVVTVRGPNRDRLSIDGETYKGEWSNGIVKVFLPTEQSDRRADDRDRGPLELPRRNDDVVGS